ncbi:hypothetical protein BTA51_09255 [Hahella sp. CCB-MM4]|uniref:BMP family ABC transporter substrate-binding protein n=1 Tax=Hahella sp. (strain CCB-MM4) TaxID=1926491 RepID=UPI000B9ACAAF|nr:BMP family ABC transporter substrate-binding protein [Hahella sp. CCB-MM4]OZG73956.1 hypothetical protein BTA51_09255 [Hahella sp. CCB-MM4]
MDYFKSLLIVLIGLSGAVHAEAVKVAFVYPSPVGEAGWSFAHDQGRKYLETNYPNSISTVFSDKVPTGSESRGTIQGYAKQGYDLVITASKDFGVQTSQAAKEFPGTRFINIGGYRSSDNLSQVQIRGYQGRYLTGLIAGGMTKSNVIGFVAAFPVPEVTRGINAFTLGVREANPKAVVKVKWSHSWFDPETEKKLANELIAEGADILSSQVDSVTTLEVAEEKGVYTFGFYSDMSRYAPRYHLTSVVYEWGKVYEDFLNDALNSKLSQRATWQGVAEGAVTLSHLNADIPIDIVNMVEARRQQIASGEYHVFQGPVKNQRGWVVIKEGNIPSDQELQGMTWYAEGIDGRMPSL